ncbi:MAG TPA: DNA methyltransferase [Chitinophagaceae bacterium]|nr:DNA methyltransferase [Chitinophagaceae bacterium]
MYVLPTMPNNSVDLSVYSPPFAGLYNYSSSENDFSNCETKEQFLQQYEFLIKEQARVTKPGCINAVHCTDVMNSKTEVLWDFPHEIIALHEKYGFDYKNRITIWKEPLKVRMRTMVRSLMHKLIVEDSSKCFTASPDYVLVFKKRGEREIPVTHPCGLMHYAGHYPLLIAHLETYGIGGPINPIWNEETKKQSITAGIESYINQSFEQLQKKYKDWEDQKTNKLSHIIWQRYASSVWDDIRISNVLQYKESKEEDDEKHVHPLQLDVIDRIVELYSNPGEVVFTPFMGVGSEIFSPVSMGRKAIGVELKESYYRQAVKNLKDVKNRFKNDKVPELFTA